MNVYYYFCHLNLALCNSTGCCRCGSLAARLRQRGFNRTSLGGFDCGSNGVSQSASSTKVKSHWGSMALGIGLSRCVFNRNRFPRGWQDGVSAKPSWQAEIAAANTLMVVGERCLSNMNCRASFSCDKVYWNPFFTRQTCWLLNSTKVLFEWMLTSVLLPTTAQSDCYIKS